MAMDYYQLYLYRIFMLGQMDIRLYSQEKQPLFDLTCPRKNTAAVQAEDKALDYFVSHLIQDYEKLKGNVLIATRYGFTFCGGKIELAQGSCFLVIGPFYLKTKTAYTAPELNDPELRVFENVSAVNSFLPLLFDSFQDTVTDSFGSNAPDLSMEDSIPFNDNQAIERNHEREAAIRSAVYHGNMNRIKELLRSGAFVSAPHYNVGNAMRNLRNFTLTLNALTSRAAIDGGCSLYYIRSLSAYYAAKIEQAGNAEELTMLSREFCERYCRLSAEAHGKSYSPIVNQCIGYLQMHLSEDITLERLAVETNVSYAYLSRLLKKECGQNFTQLLSSLRLKRASKYLLRGVPVLEVAERTGFKSSAHFCRAFKKYWGYTPSQWIRQEVEKESSWKSYNLPMKSK